MHKKHKYKWENKKERIVLRDKTPADGRPIAR